MGHNKKDTGKKIMKLIKSSLALALVALYVDAKSTGKTSANRVKDTKTNKVDIVATAAPVIQKVPTFVPSANGNLAVSTDKVKDDSFSLNNSSDGSIVLIGGKKYIYQNGVKYEIQSQDKVEIYSDLQNAIGHLKLFHQAFALLDKQNEKLADELEEFKKNPNIMKVVQMINQSKDQIKQLDKDESTLNKLIQNQRNENAKINLQLAEKERQHQEVILKLKSHQNILDTQDETWANQQEQKKIQENNMKDLIRQVQQENSQNEKELRECQNGNSINLNRKNQLEKELKNCKANKQILAKNSANSNTDSQLRTCRAKLAQTNIQSLTLQVENCKKESTNCNNNWHQCEKDKETNASKKVLAQAAADQCKLQRGAIV